MSQRTRRGAGFYPLRGFASNVAPLRWAATPPVIQDGPLPPASISTVWAIHWATDPTGSQWALTPDGHRVWIGAGWPPPWPTAHRPAWLCSGAVADWVPPGPPVADRWWDVTVAHAMAWPPLLTPNDWAALVQAGWPLPRDLPEDLPPADPDRLAPWAVAWWRWAQAQRRVFRRTGLWRAAYAAMTTVTGLVAVHAAGWPAADPGLPQAWLRPLRARRVAAAVQAAFWADDPLHGPPARRRLATATARETAAAAHLAAAWDPAAQVWRERWQVPMPGQPWRGDALWQRRLRMSRAVGALVAAPSHRQWLFVRGCDWDVRLLAAWTHDAQLLAACSQDRPLTDTLGEWWPTGPTDPNMQLRLWRHLAAFGGITALGHAGHVSQGLAAFQARFPQVVAWQRREAGLCHTYLRRAAARGTQAGIRTLLGRWRWLESPATPRPTPGLAAPWIQWRWLGSVDDLWFLAWAVVWDLAQDAGWAIRAWTGDGWVLEGPQTAAPDALAIRLRGRLLRALTAWCGDAAVWRTAMVIRSGHGWLDSPWAPSTAPRPTTPTDPRIV